MHTVLTVNHTRFTRLKIQVREGQEHLQLVLARTREVFLVMAARELVKNLLKSKVRKTKFFFFALLAIRNKIELLVEEPQRSLNSSSKFY